MNNHRCYSEYVQHCLRFYTRYPNPEFRSEANKNDWTACKTAFSRLSDHEREVLTFVYQEGDTLPDNVYQICKRKHLSQDYVWKLMFNLEKEVARERGLL